MAAYRIVRESLTNTIRHAGPSTAAVWIGYHHDELRIDVTDTGYGQPPGPSGAAGAAGRSAGRGLPGMRERAAAVGGTVEAGPGPGGGFRVAARLPLEGDLTGPPAGLTPGPGAAAAQERMS
jgi:signal transduction histidine kinase